MNNDLLKYIDEYFKTFNPKEYTIYINGRPSDWRIVKTNKVVYRLLPLPSPDFLDTRELFDIKEEEIKEVSITTTALTIKKKNGEEYTFIAKVKVKEEKVKDLIRKAKGILLATVSGEGINEVYSCLDAIYMLMDE